MQHRTRAIWILICLACGFTVISVNLIKIQLVEHEKYRAMAIANNVRSETIPPTQGSIFDADRNLLAETQTRTDLRLDGKMIDHPAEQLSQVAEILQVPPQPLIDGFDPRKRDLLLAANLDDGTVSKLAALKMNALIFIPHNRRFYPNNELGAHILGYTDADGRGLSGIEKEMGASLSGVPGVRWVTRDGKGKVVPGYQLRETPARDGDDVTLTIRSAIQHAVEEQLDQIVQNYQPGGAYIIVMDPHTGQILAMGSRPTFDPNDSRTFRQENVHNGCLTDMVEPGSIFKIITLAGALNEGAINLNTQIFCENGEFNYGGKVLHDDGEQHTWLSAMEVMAQSSNIGFAKIALTYLHEEKLYQYARAFGIGQKTGLFTQQMESPGLLRPLNLWSGLSITRIPMGQEVAATPIQIATAMCVIANGGRLVLPQLVSKVTDRTGRVVQFYPPRTVRQVISADAARQVARALEQVTIDGTAKGIRIVDVNGEGLSFGGKTGTAQKFVDGEYSHTQHVASFVGFAPAEDPAFVVMVMVDSPRTARARDYGALVSAPVFAAIARQTAQILNVPFDIPASGGVPTLTSYHPRP